MPSPLRPNSPESFRADQIHQEISDELQFHIESKSADLIRNGTDPEEARRIAHQSFGRIARVREESFDVRGPSRWEDLAGEVRWAWRLLRKNPLKTAVLIATLASGVGANTAAFGIIRSVLLQPLPFASPGELVVLHQSDHGQHSGVSYPHLQDWRERNRSFSGIAAYLPTTATLTGSGEAFRVNGAIVSASLFRILGTHPLRGQLFTEADDQRSGKSTVLLSDRLWRKRFNERGDILGQTVRLDGRAYEIAGILPSAGAFPIARDPVDYWITVAADADPALYGGTIPTSRGYPRYAGAIARLRPGITQPQAAADMDRVAQTIARQYPHSTSANEVAVIPALEEIVGPASRTMVWLLYGAVLCVLLVACVNIANILLADALRRRREFALRTALGAGTAQLVRQILVESIVLALVASVASLAAAFILLRLFVAFAPPDTPRLADIHLDLTAVLYVAAVSLLSGVVIGCLPALSIPQAGLVTLLKEGAASVSHRATGLRPGPVLLALQIALGMVLTTSAVLLSTSFSQILHSPRGFNPHATITAAISLPPSTYGQRNDRVRTFYRNLLEQVRALPSVQSATLGDVLPLSGDSNSTTVTLVGVNEPGLPATDLRFTDPQYFSTLRIPLQQGRFFSDRDTRDRPPCAMVNQAFVRRYLAGRNPLAAALQLGWGGNAAKQIVGVVGDIRPNAAVPSITPEVYIPFAQFPLNDMSLLIRSTGTPDQLSSALRTIVAKLDPLVPIDRVRTLDEYLLLSAAPQQFLMWLLLVFAGATVLLASVGIYGVMSNATAARCQEFGVRLALGASRWQIARLVLSQALKIAATGICTGVLLSHYATQLLTAWLYEGTNNLTAVLAGSAAGLLLVILAACAIPSRRATAVDPASVLRTS